MRAKPFRLSDSGTVTVTCNVRAWPMRVACWLARRILALGMWLSRGHIIGG